MQNSAYPFITPSSTCLSEDLLFFDTFSHYGSEEDNFDLVQFPSPVVIDLIKIVPLGQPVEAKIPGNVRLGATNPSNCQLEFFINDLTKQDAHTMTDLGKFYCSEKETDFNPPLQVQTDGLLLRGSYRTLTLAIFGQIATYDEKVEDEPPISAASPPAQTPASPIASEHDIPYIVQSVDPELMRRVRDGSESLEDELPPIRKSSELNNINRIEPLTVSSGRNNADITVEMIDETSINEPLETDPTNVKDKTGLEDMSSNEDMLSNKFNLSDKKCEDLDYSNSGDLDNNNYQKRTTTTTNTTTTITTTNSKDDFENRFSGVNNNNASSNNDDQHPTYDEDDNNSQEAREWYFNVDTYSPKPLIYFPNPSLTLQERSISAYKSKHLIQEDDDIEKREIDRVKEMFDTLNCTDDYKSEEWVSLIEDLTNEIANMSLSQIISNEEMLKFLVGQVSHGLDMNLALRQKQTGFKVRHLRSGIKLATVLFHSGVLAVKTLLEASIPKKLLQLYDKEQMSLPLRLLIFKCLNAACDSVEGSDHIIESHYDWYDTKFTMTSIKKLIAEKEQQQQQQQQQPQSRRNTTEREDPMSTNDKFTKSHTQESSDDVLLSTDESPRIGLNHRNSVDNLITDDDKTGQIHNTTCYQYMLLILLSQPTTRVTIAIGNLIKKIRLYQCFKKLSNIQLEDSEDSDNVFHSEEKLVKRAELLEETLTILQDIVSLTRNNCVEIAQPIRHLPAKVQFQVKPNTTDTYLAVFKWLTHFRTLEYLNSLFKALQNYSLDSSSSKIEQSIKIQNLCLEFLQQLIDSPRGAPLLLSSSQCEITGCLIKSLASKQPPKRSSHVRVSDGIEDYLSESLLKEESLSASSCNYLSIKMCYNLKIFSCIDKLFHFHRELISKREESTLCDPEKVLHQLYIMSDHPYGLAAIIKHFSSIGNLDCLLRFLDMPEHHRQLEFVKETSIDYALELIGTFFRLNNNVLEIADEYLNSLIELCKNKEKTLSVRIRSLLPWLTPFNTEKPLPLITYSEDTFKQLTRIIRKSIPNNSIPFANGLNFELPPHMITAVRILRQLCIPPQVESFIESNFDIYSTRKLIANSNISKSISFTNFINDEQVPHEQNNNQSWNLNLQLFRNNGQALNNLADDCLIEQLGQISNTFKLFHPYEESICGDLKYHYGIMQTFEQEGLKRLLNTLRELTGNYPRPIYQSAALSGFRGRIVLSYIHSVVVLLHSIVCHLIDARGSEFKDTSVIGVILEAYSLLCFVPKPKETKFNKIDSVNNNNEPTRHDIAALQKSITLKSDNYHLAQQTKKLIISLLMAYTQMCLSVSESEEKVISKSMWTKMLKEVIDFTLSTPVFFHHGLDVLTKILPQPLPCSSMMDSIDQEQLFKNINHRKLWSAHLHPLHQQIEQMMSHLSICCQIEIRTCLYNLCNQLCDLSSNAACLVAKIITDNLIAYVSKLSAEATSSNPIGADNNSTTATTTSSGNSIAEQQNVPQQQNIIGNNQPNEDRSKTNASVAPKSTKAISIFGFKMVLNLLTNLITNQAFETAFSNQLLTLSKKDEKLLQAIQHNVKLCLNENNSLNDPSNDDCNMSGGGGNSSLIVNQLIDLIKAINDSNLSKDGLVVATSDINPPEELSKINLLEVARRTSDRFALPSNLMQTYRLKVLLDLQSHAHRTAESTSSSSNTKRFDHSTTHNYQELSVPSGHKSYHPPPLRGRARPIARPDSFRSRPQNTSRPPSIHVDDFVDMYGDSLAAANVSSGATSSPVSSSQRYKQITPKTPMADYRGSSRGYQEQSPSLADMNRHSNSFFGPQLQPPPPPPHSGSPLYNSTSGRSQMAKGNKYMKMK